MGLTEWMHWKYLAPVKSRWLPLSPIPRIMDTNESIPGPFVVINGDNWREMAGIGASTKTLEQEKNRGNGE